MDAGETRSNQRKTREQSWQLAGLLSLILDCDRATVADFSSLAD